MSPQYGRVAERAGHRCEYCQAPEAIFNFPFEVEHIVPPRHGGADEDANLALSCRSCNVFKSDSLEAIDPEGGGIVTLFNPRQNRWVDHFTVNNETGNLAGLTACGRATVSRLRLNETNALRARKHWMRLKLFPPS
jgi:hypothetical protein